MHSHRQFIVEVILLYKKLPCLWKKADPDYCDKNKREMALEQLVDLFKTQDINADKDLVQRKISSLRGCYRKEYNKVKASLKSGASTNYVHIPKLWYYNFLTFLEDQNVESTSGTMGSVLDNMPFGFDEDCEEDSSESTNVPMDQNVVQVKIDCEEDSNESAGEPSASSSDTRWLQDSSEARTTPQRFKRPRQRSKADQVLEKIARKMDQSLEKQSDIKQKYDSFGEYVAEKLRCLQPNMAIYCQKIINDAMFLAETGNLNISSKIVTSMSNSTDMNSVTSEYVSDVDSCLTHVE
ncbi:hypothetical protein AVEN_94353-1 [Araneus ventricosus]|uniref:MADF domain-containing protein n=1 Tax=Araneus ventricosus TaxID=182803 RepID=A0A4Y2ECX9_ARAVE|nr:hypothetical protein AVEN_94353-1 [Araneus ventricosus]